MLDAEIHNLILASDDILYNLAFGRPAFHDVQISVDVIGERQQGKRDQRGTIKSCSLDLCVSR